MRTGEILARLRERIVGFAASRVGRDSAEDIAQEVLILLHERYAHVESLDELLPLSFQIVRFKVMALRRKAARRGEAAQVAAEDFPLPDGRPDPETAAAQREMRERLIRAIAQLGGRCRRLFALKLGGMGFAGIQAAMGAPSINTVYTWDFRCRRDLLARMGGDWELRQ